MASVSRDRYSREQLVRMMREGSSDLWPLLYQIARKAVGMYYGGFSDQEELVQVAVVKCFEKIPAYDPGCGTPCGYFFGICHVAAHDYLRKEKRQSLADWTHRLNRVRGNIKAGKKNATTRR